MRSRVGCDWMFLYYSDDRKIFMAQPDEQIQMVTNLDDDPAYAEQLGHISVAWANLEWNMYLLFEVMSGSPPALARSVFYAIDSNRGRREMIQGVSRVLFEGHKSEESILEDILRRIGRSASQRNKFVHDTWGVARTQKREVFQMRLSTPGRVAQMQEVTIPDLKAAADNIRKLANELNVFCARIRPKTPALLEKYRELPGLGLAFSERTSSGKEAKRVSRPTLIISAQTFSSIENAFILTILACSSHAFP